VTFNNSVTVKGNVEAGTTFTNNNSPTIQGNVTAVGGITTKGATVSGSVTSGGDLNITNATFRVGGNMKAVGAITSSGANVSGVVQSDVKVTMGWSDSVSGVITAPSLSFPNGKTFSGGTQNGNPGVTAPSAPAPPPSVDLPPVDVSAAKNANSNATITVSAPWSSGGSGALSSVLDSNNNLNVTQGQTVTLKGGTYYFNSITLANAGSPSIKVDSSVTVDNPVKIYVSGNINIQGGTLNNSTQRPRNLQIYSASTNMGSNPSAVQLASNASVYAALYAPQGSVSFTQGATWYGSCVGGSYSSNGGTTLHYDADLLNVTMSNSSSSASSAPGIVSWDRR
jgi:cytoskeletal protein CcmA (bactofilin family)